MDAKIVKMIKTTGINEKINPKEQDEALSQRMLSVPLDIER